MEVFTLDTSGYVTLRREDASWKGRPRPDIYWEDLSPFEQGYIEALLQDLASGPLIRLSAEDSAVFAGALLNPAKPNEALEKASKRYREAVAAQKASGIFPTPILVAAPGFSDLSPEALGAIRKDCAAYLAKAAESEAEVRAYSGASNAAKVRQAWLGGGGKQFWEQRNTTDSLKAFWPPLTVVLSDEGKVCLRGAA